MDEREMRDRLNEIHNFVTVDADRRDKDAQARHAEMMRAIEQLTKTFERGLRDLADALRTQRH